MLTGADTIYTWPATRSLSDKVETKVLQVEPFTIATGGTRQVMAEVFFDPQFYDIELLLESR